MKTSLCDASMNLFKWDAADSGTMSDGGEATDTLVEWLFLPETPFMRGPIRKFDCVLVSTGGGAVRKEWHAATRTPPRSTTLRPLLDDVYAR